MPPVQSPKKPSYYYPHEEFFFWVLAAFAFTLAINYGGVNFVVALILGVALGIWPMVFLGWFLWKEWDDSRDH